MSKSTDAGDSLEFTPALWEGIKEADYEPVVLVAPNKRVQKIWQEAYPGVKVVLAGKL